VNAWEMLPDSSYRLRPARRGNHFCAQTHLAVEYGQDLPLET
jgi:polyphosphate kinase